MEATTVGLYRDCYKDPFLHSDAKCPGTLELYMRNGKENGKHYNGLYKDYYKDPCLHSDAKCPGCDWKKGGFRVI